MDEWRNMQKVVMVIFLVAGLLGKVYSGDPPGPPTPVEMPIHPSQRMWGSLIFDPVSTKILLFGGLRYNDTWLLNLANHSWAQMDAVNVPDVRRVSGVIATYERHARRLIAFIYEGAGLNGETWSYDPQSNSWQNMLPINSPLGRRFTSLVYDSKVDKIFLFGGEVRDDNYVPNNELWSYDFQKNMWTEQYPKNSPPPTSFPHIVYDPSVDRVIMWGGSPLRESKEVWWYDYSIDTWTKTNYDDGPNPDYDGAMAYSPFGNQIFLYVGDQFWSFNSNQQRWAQLPTAGGPGRQYGSSIVFDEVNRRLVLFGGAGGNEDTWLYDPYTRVWSVMKTD